MSEFHELIKKFNKCRDYVRDFFVYGFKSREDFHYKSSRTYDDERRRIESWLSEYVRQDYQEMSKNISLQMDSNLLETNPLYRVWKTKSFTDADITLHFYLLDLLHTGAWLSVNTLTDQILEKYGTELDPQMVRRKCKEYEKEGLLLSRKDGKVVLYHAGATLHTLTSTIMELSDEPGALDHASSESSDDLDALDHTFSESSNDTGSLGHTSSESSDDPDALDHASSESSNDPGALDHASSESSDDPGALDHTSSELPDETRAWQDHLLDAISFFQLSAPFGLVGSTLSDQQFTENRVFRIKHSFLVHTLEDEILLVLMEAMRLPAAVKITTASAQGKSEHSQYGLPLRIFVSTRTGRRYLCFYHWNHRSAKGQFHGIRLDQIKTAEICSQRNTPDSIHAFLEQETARYNEILEALDRNQNLVWGVSFQGNYRHAVSRTRKQTVHLTLYVNEETEQHILHRLEREGKGGIITRLAPNTYQYEKTVFDAQEMVPWLRTFICRIIELTVTEPGNDETIPPETNRLFSRRFQQDLQEMYQMYDI